MSEDKKIILEEDDLAGVTGGSGGKNFAEIAEADGRPHLVMYLGLVLGCNRPGGCRIGSPSLYAATIISENKFGDVKCYNCGMDYGTVELGDRRVNK